MTGAKSRRAKVSAKGWVVIPASYAAHIKANHAISYADAFAVAPAEELDAPVLTGDPGFGEMEPLVQVFWLCGTASQRKGQGKGGHGGGRVGQSHLDQVLF
jgi:hypothetical protein